MRTIHNYYSPSIFTGVRNFQDIIGAMLVRTDEELKLAPMIARIRIFWPPGN